MFFIKISGCFISAELYFKDKELLLCMFKSIFIVYRKSYNINIFISGSFFLFPGNIIFVH